MRLAPDSALPARDLLLEQSVAAALLEEALDLGPITRCRRLRTTYRIGESLRVLFEVEGTRDHLVATRMVPAGASGQLFQRVARVCPSAVHRPDIGLVLWRFPDDAKVTALRALMPGSPAIGSLLGDPTVRPTLVSYVPEKGATAVCHRPDGRAVAYAKAYATNEGRRTAGIHDLVRAHGIPAPPVLDYDPHRRLLLVAPGRGTAVALDNVPEAAAQIGLTLGRLHGVGAPADRDHKRLDPAGLAKAAALLGSARPELASRAVALADGLRASPPRRRGEVLVHGDVHFGNVLLGPAGAELIDLDQAAAGQAAAELGSLLALLRYERIIGRLSMAAEQSGATALLDGYERVRALPEPRSIAWHLAAALFLERALRAVRRVRESGLDHLDEIIGEAEHIAASPACGTLAVTA